MEKLKFSDIKHRIDKLLNTIPLTLEYTKSSSEDSEIPNQSVSFGGEVIPSIGSSSKYQQRHKFIYNVIFGNVYYKEKGNRLRVSDAEIQSTFNMFTRLVEAFEGLNNLEEFTEYLYPQARQVLIDEQAELQNFENGPLIDKLIHKDKYLVTLRNQIFSISGKLKIITQKSNELIKLMTERKITSLEFIAGLDEIDEDYHFYRSMLDPLLAKHKGMSEKAFYRRRTILKKCFSFEDLQCREPKTNPSLKYRDITTVKFLIQEYCRWHNAGIADKMEEAMRNKGNENKRLRRLKAKVDTSQYKKKQERITLINPYLNSDISDSEISRLTGIPKSTLQRLLREIRSK